MKTIMNGSRTLPPANLKSIYGQTGNVKPLTANRNLSFAVNLDLKVSIIIKLSASCSHYLAGFVNKMDLHILHYPACNVIILLLLYSGLLKKDLFK